MKISRINPKAGLFSVFLVSMCALSTSAYASQPSLGPVNPDFQNYIQDNKKLKAEKQTINESHALGFTPPAVDFSHMKGQKISGNLKATKDLLIPAVGGGVYPASYDLRALGKLTPVKNQSIFNTCWAFATYGSMESCLEPGESRDFSEKNLVNLTGYDEGDSGGGNYLMSTAYLAKWGGPVNETDDPYPSGTWATSPNNLQVQKHVQEVLFIPDRGSSTDNDNIKEMVTNYGAVMTSMYMDQTVSHGYLNPNTTSYYFNGSSTTNHAVDIVGWDDNYPASNFTITPPGNGAFIAKNQWGTAWGDGGYFYISYYDSKAGTYNAVFDDAESTGNYSKVYQYDPLGMTSNEGYGSNTSWGANIFTAGINEQLKAAGFYTQRLNTAYSLYVYSNYSGGSFSGLLGSCSGTIAVAGYHTVALNSPIPLPPGQNFCVVMELTTPGLNYPIPIEFPHAGSSSQATASPGQSYISNDGSSWVDITSYYANTNVCLKAYTLIIPTITVTSITPNSGANTGQVSITNLAGTGFVTGTTCALSKSGQTSINPTGITVVSPTQITCSFNLTGQATGYWDVVVSTGSLSATLAGGFQITPMNISSITPNHGVNTGIVNITNLSGSGFLTGSTVKLEKVGQSTVTASGVTVVSQSQITCSFDLTGLATGYWDVIVSTSGAGSLSAALASGFIVNSSATVSVTLSSGTLTGKITKADRTSALQGAVVQALLNGTTIAQSAVADTAGNYYMQLATGTYNITVSSTGYVTQVQPGQAVLAGLTTTVNFSLAAQVTTVSNTATGGDTLSNAHPYPSFANLSQGGKINFAGITPEADVKIFTPSGNLIKTLKADANGIVPPWDGTVEGGGKAGSGTYIIHASDGKGNKKTFKILLLR